MATTYASTPYRGQSQFLPSGYMEAATAPGRSIAAGIEQAGKAIGEGLGAAVEGYMAGKKETAELDAQYESLAGEVISQPISLSDDDPMKGELESRASELVKSGKAWGDMSRAKKKQHIADLLMFRDMQSKSAQRQLGALQLQELKGKRDAAELAARGNMPVTQQKEVPNMVEQTQPLIGPLPKEYYSENEVVDFNALANRPTPETQALTAPEPEFRPNATLTPDQYAVSEVSRSAPKKLPDGYDAEFFRRNYDDMVSSVTKHKRGRGGIVRPVEVRPPVLGGYPRSMTDEVKTKRGRGVAVSYPLNYGKVIGTLDALEAKGFDTPEMKRLRYLSKLYGGAQAQPQAAPTAPPQGYASAPAPASVTETEPLPMTTVYSQTKDRPMETFTVQDGTKMVPTTPEEQAAERSSRFEKLATQARELGLGERFIQQAHQSVFPKQAMPQVVDVGGVKFFDDGSGKFSPVPVEDRKKMTDTGVSKMVEIRAAYDDLSRIKEKFSEIGVTGPLLGILRNKNPYDKKAVEMKAVIDQAVPNLARGIFGEVGVLTDADVKRYTEMLPSINTPAALAELLVQGLENKLRSYEENFIKTYNEAGYDVSGIRADQAASTKPSDTTKTKTVEVNLGKAIIEPD